MRFNARNTSSAHSLTPFFAILFALLTPPVAAQGPAPVTRNIVLVMTDGLRWQEVFRGPDESLLTKEHGVENAYQLKKDFCRDTPEASREALLPFLWSSVAARGQIYGNRDRGSDCHVTNDQWFSYPGYNETFCGFADPSIDSNKKIPNPNTTVFEWLNTRPEYRGRVAGFGAWDVFPFIVNTDRAGFLVDDSIQPITAGTLTPGIELINKLRAETPRRWAGGHFDALMFNAAAQWTAANQPRILFVLFGETDEWAHEGDYDHYLRAAHRADAFTRELWDLLQSIPQYRGATSLVITTDHGRGDNSAGPKDWNNHGAKHPGSDQMWLAVIGPDTPPLGERRDCPPVTQSQAAATLAALLGESWPAAEPRAAGPIADVLHPHSPLRAPAARPSAEPVPPAPPR